MAFPVIKIDSTDGAASDSACSGAGPATAVTGTCHNNNGVDGFLTVSGSLTGVATDGSHAIYVETSSGRRFARITNISGSQVTTANAFPAIDSGTPANYAIGGVRATLSGTNSLLLMEQAASAAGDASAGWTIEMQSGHTETIASTINVRVANSSTDGVLTIQGAGATRPVLSFSNNGNGFALQAGSPQFRNLVMKNTNATKTASAAIAAIGSMVVAEPSWLTNVTIADSTDYFWRGITSSTNSHFALFLSEIGHCANGGIYIDGGVTFSTARMLGSYIHDCGDVGVYLDQANATLTSLVYRSVIANNGSHGMFFQGSADSTNFGDGIQFVESVFDNNTGSGLYFNVQRAASFCTFTNCQFTNNGVYGIRLPTASSSENYFRLAGHHLVGCNFYGNTTAPTSISGLETSDAAIGCYTLNPSYVNAASGDYRIGNATLLTGGYPAGNIAGTITPAFPTVGADQAAGGSTFIPTFRRRSSPQLRM